MDNGFYEVGTGTRVRAFHVMPGMPEPEGSLHAHDYRIEVVVERAGVDAEGMVCDLDLLDGALAELADRLEGKDLELIRPPHAKAVTVEVFARWAHGALAATVARAGGEALRVRVWESDTAFAGYYAPVNSP